jgi:hypothetical protein
MIKRPVPLMLTVRRTPSKLTYWRTLLTASSVPMDEALAATVRANATAGSVRLTVSMAKF